MDGKRFFIYTLLVLTQVMTMCRLIAQVKQKDVDAIDELLEHLLEMIPDEVMEELSWAELNEMYDHLASNPLDLNLVSSKELERLLFLSPREIKSIIAHRQQFGRFASVYELQSVTDLSASQAQLLANFVFVSDSGTDYPHQSITSKTAATQRVLLRYDRTLEKSMGFHITDTQRSRYLGSPNKFLLRYSYNRASNLKLNLTLEKDAGEPWRDLPENVGFDHLSFSVQKRTRFQGLEYVLGDFQVQWGQGLSLWQGYSTQKGAIVHGIAKSSVGLKAHTSADEWQYYRGVALNFPYRRYKITTFYSIRNFDASVEEIDEGQGRLFSAFAKSGLHRTPYELASRKTVRVNSYGIRGAFEGEQIQAGGYVLGNHFDGRLEPAEAVRNTFAFAGTNFNNAGLFYRMNLFEMHFFGELATTLSKQAGIAYINGVLLDPHPSISLGIIFRNYTRRFHSLFPQSFGFNSSTSNEQGYYFGLQYQPNRAIRWMYYIDYADFSWMKYRVDAPSMAWDYFTEFEWSPSRNERFLVRYRYRVNSQNDTESEYFNRLVDVKQQQFRIRYERNLGSFWKVRLRLERSIFQKGDADRKQGNAWMTDFIFKPLGSRWSGNFRFANVNTSDYDTRIYAFENDVQFASSVRAYFNRGLRTYVNARWRLSSAIDLWLKYSLTHNTNQQPIGSGLDALNRSRRQDVRLQAQVKF